MFGLSAKISAREKVPCRVFEAVTVQYMKYGRCVKRIGGDVSENDAILE